METGPPGVCSWEQAVSQVESPGWGPPVSEAERVCAHGREGDGAG